MTQITMDISSLSTIKQLNTLNKQGYKILYKNREEKYEKVRNLLNAVEYKKLEKRDKQIVIEFLQNALDYDTDYLYHLIAKYLKNRLYVRQYVRKNPHKRYGNVDIKLLAETDILHKRLSAPATKHILLRLAKKYGKEAFENISKVSIPHINNLRKRPVYDCLYKNGTKARLIPIGERTKPQPNGKPGYFRVDTVHQRDVFYLNLVDEVLQWEVVACIKQISEAFLAPVLEVILKSVPFVIQNFHSDNGGECINYTVAKLLEKMHIYQTKSRSRHCNDNALVESKNGHIIRKHWGYAHLDQGMAPKINIFCQNYFNEYLNFHRPSAFRKEVTRDKKKIIYVYEEYKTPYEKLKSLEHPEQYLKPGITLEDLNKIELRYDDNEYAKLMEKEKRKMFRSIKNKDIMENSPFVS